MNIVALPIFPSQVRQEMAGSFIEIPFACVDRLLNPITPSAIRYRVDNLSDSVQIKDWTSISAAQSGTITVTAAENAMTRQWRQRQINQVTIEYTTSAGVRQETKLYELLAVYQAATS